MTFLRGDAWEDGVVGIADAVVIFQYLTGVRSLENLHALNAASTRNDGTWGDQITVADPLFILQVLVGLRNPDYFVP